MFCPNCYNDSLTEIKEEVETLSVKDMTINIVSKIAYCKECGNQIWNKELDEENLKRAYDEYKKANSLLSSAYIKRIRENYGLTQTLFSKLLGFGEKTIARYENGAIQDIAHNNLILLASKTENLEKLFQNSKSRLNSDEINQAKTALSKKEAIVYRSGEIYEPKTKNYFGGYWDERKQCYGDYFSDAI